MAQAAFGPGYYPICVVTRLSEAAPQLLASASVLLRAAEESRVPVLIFSNSAEVRAHVSSFSLTMCEGIAGREDDVSPAELMMRAAGLTTIWSSRCDLIETLARVESRRYFLTGAMLWLDCSAPVIMNGGVAVVADALAKTRECVRARLARGLPIGAWIALPPEPCPAPAAMMCNALAAFILCDLQGRGDDGLVLEQTMRASRWTEEDVSGLSFWNAVELQQV